MTPKDTFIYANMIVSISNGNAYRILTSFSYRLGVFGCSAISNIYFKTLLSYFLPNLTAKRVIVSGWLFLF